MPIRSTFRSRSGAEQYGLRVARGSAKRPLVGRAIGSAARGVACATVRRRFTRSGVSPHFPLLKCVHWGLKGFMHSTRRRVFEAVPTVCSREILGNYSAFAEFRPIGQF